MKTSLWIRDSESGPFRRWSTGWAYYLTDHRPDEGAPMNMALQVKFGDLELQAMLDTGAAWSVLSQEWFDELDPGSYEPTGEPATLTTRLGAIDGQLYRVTMRLIADEGETLVIDGTVLVSDKWPSSHPVIGFRNCLDRVRFAVDPPTSNAEAGRIHFALA